MQRRPRESVIATKINGRGRGRQVHNEREKMFIVKAIDGIGDQESRVYIEEAFWLAALRAKETETTQGLFCPDKDKPFASVNKYLWEKL